MKRLKKYLIECGTITLADYKPNHLTYTSDAPAEQLAVFSEIWYGPDKGWQAYVDGAPVPHIRADYLLRAMRVPAGQHKIEFVFDPAAFKRGKAISFASSLLILLVLMGWGGWRLRDYFAHLPAVEAPVPKVKATPAPAKGKPGKKR